MKFYWLIQSTRQISSYIVKGYRQLVNGSKYSENINHNNHCIKVYGQVLAGLLP